MVGCKHDFYSQHETDDTEHHQSRYGAKVQRRTMRIINEETKMDSPPFNSQGTLGASDRMFGGFYYRYMYHKHLCIPYVT